MCGINGYMQFGNLNNENTIRELITSMNNEIIHRGPDDGGVFVKENVGLGMRRLSIIDLSQGDQPIFNEDKSLVIVFNGEIYNYKQLKGKLLEKGHTFYTSSDTEVLIHAYEEYGEKCLNHLDGMFAFAIYDMKEENIFIARDRVGEKPLYYHMGDDFLIFGSELKSLLTTKLLMKEVDEIALQQFLQLTYIPAPLTIYKNVYKLEAANYLKIDMSGDVVINKYWDLEYSDHNLIYDYDKCKKMLREKVFESVESRMMSDVPLGAFLSGGIDSTTIVGVMSKISKKPINTFTIGFKNKEFDESNRAKKVAELYKTNHHVHFLNYSEVVEEIDEIIDKMDEPFADSSLIPSFMVAKYASKHVKTVLTGDAGDELFAGYSKYLINYYSEKYNKVPQFIRENIIEKIAGKMPDKNRLTRKINKVIDNSQQDVFSRRRNLMSLSFKEHELNLLLKDYKTNTLDFIKSAYDKYENTTNEISQTLYTDFKVVLEGDMLAKVDRSSMLNSLETRTPLLSKDIIELSAKIPIEYKINNKDQKIIFKDAFKDIIPESLSNASKRGFGVPIDHWFRNELKGELLKVLDKKVIENQGIFNFVYIKLILDEHMAGRRNRKSELWSLFVFQKWYFNNIDSIN